VFVLVQAQYVISKPERRRVGSRALARATELVPGS